MPAKSAIKNLILLGILICEFYFLNIDCYATPCYGTKMPRQKQFFLGLQDHIILKRYLEHNQGKVRSQQNLLQVSYGVFDWLSIDLKGGAGDIKQHPADADEMRYPDAFAGGYGFRARFYDKNKIKAVFGFQHISVHPKSIHVSGIKHRAILDDWQVSALVSYDFKKFTPYLGTRWSRVDYIHWRAENRKRTMSSPDKEIGLIFGLDIPITQKIWINLEGQALDSEAAAFSLNYSF